MTQCAPAPGVRLTHGEYSELEGIGDVEPEKQLYCLRFLELQRCDCGLVLRYLTSMHRIVVFDDPMCPIVSVKHKFDVELAPYTVALGPCVAYEQYVAEGRLAHREGEK